MISILFRALILGSLYALASIGLSLQWGVLKNLNFSHGVCITVGAYIMWFTVASLGLPFVLALVIMLALTFLLGGAIELIAIRPFFMKNDTNIFFATVALSSILSQVMLIIFGGREKVLLPIIPGNFQFGSLHGANHELFSMAVTAVTMLALWLILSKTLTGLSIQAVSQDLVGARLAGIGTRRVYAITMGVATIIAGIAGMLLAPIFFVNPHMGESPMTKAFIVVILGGLGSLKGTVVAALLVALVEVLVGMYIGVTWASTALFGLMIVILLFKPDGLYGKRLRAA